MTDDRARFSLRQLTYFIAAGETGSVTLAAERVAISQPSISTAISHLEREFGVQLFVRHHAQGLSLTPIGRTMLVEAKKLVDQADGLYAVASEASGQIRGRLSFGCMVTLAPMIVPELAQSFVATYPAVDLSHLEADHERLIEALRRAEIDAVVTYDLSLPSGIEFVPLASLVPHVVVGEAHALAARTSISLAELVDEPLILLDLPFSRDYFFALFLKEGLSPRVQSRSVYPDVIRTMVANGYGYTLANVRPRSHLALDGRRVARIALEGIHRPMVIGLAMLSVTRRSRLIEAFDAHCRTVFAGGNIPGMEAAV
jgi:DNA-binding transcriptional LysR family regulator